MNNNKKSVMSFVFGSFGIFVLGGLITTSVMCGELRRQQTVNSKEIDSLKIKAAGIPSDLDNRLRRIEEIVARIDEKLKKK